MKQRIYKISAHYLAYIIVISLWLHGCNSIQHDMAPASYIPGNFTYQEEGAQPGQMVLYTLPYRPIANPTQCAEMYTGEPQMSPYDEGEQETIIIPGKDGRIRIEKTAEWPYLFNGQLDIGYPGTKCGGSGILVGPQHILTAAHNVYDYKEKKGWAKKVEVRLGLNDVVAPYGTVEAKRFYTFKPWVETGDPAHDMALLVLDRPIGFDTGWCGLLAAQDKDLTDHPVSITGYPGDKGLKQMWSMSNGFKTITNAQLFYNIDTYGGQSGSGICLIKWGSPYAVGVHTRGCNAIANIGNSGVRLSHAKAQQVVAWINETLSIKEHINPMPSPSFLLSEVTIDALALQARHGDKEALMKLLEVSDTSHVYVQLVLGKLYEEGAGVPKNLKQAAAFYEQSARQGYAAAQYKLGWMYDNGQGVKQDYTKAGEWYQQAALQGFADAQNNLGVMYHKGYGVEIDHKQAVEWYQQAALQGHADAQNNLGVMYHKGYGVEIDHKQAVEWYQQAALQGHADAQNNLGVMYYFGMGVAKDYKRDYKKAVEWCQKAALQGHADAQNNLAGMYYYGQGVEKDDTKAVGWYQQAALQGHADAQKNLGVMYQCGYGVEEDYKQAAFWYQQAASQGNEDAQNRLNELNSNSRCVIS